MSGQNVISLDPNRRARHPVAKDATIAMLVLVTYEALMFVGMVSAFILTRATAGGAWPPAGQPRLPLEQTAVNTAALLLSGALVFLAARAWKKRTGRVGPLLLSAVALGAFFVLFQGLEWVALIFQGLAPSSGPSQHGYFFCLIVGMYGVHSLGALVLMGVAWLRLKQGALSDGTFSAARILWYFVVGAWPVLLLCLYM